MIGEVQIIGGNVFYGYVDLRELVYSSCWKFRILLALPISLWTVLRHSSQFTSFFLFERNVIFSSPRACNSNSPNENFVPVLLPNAIGSFDPSFCFRQNVSPFPFSLRWSLLFFSATCAIFACIFVWLVLIINVDFFKTTDWFSHITVFVNNFLFVEHHSITLFWGKMLHRKRYRLTLSEQSKFWIFAENQAFVRQNYCLHSIRVSIGIFLIAKSYQLAEQWVWLFETETWYVKLAKMIIAKFPVDNRTGFPSKQLPGFLIAKSQQVRFCANLSKIHMVFYYPFLNFLKGLTSWKLYIYAASLCWNYFSPSYWPQFFIMSSTGKIVFMWEALSYNPLSGSLFGWEFQNWHTHVVLLEILTYLSPKLQTGLLLSRSGWTISSVPKVGL